MALLLLNAYLLLTLGSPASLVAVRGKREAHRGKGANRQHRLLGVVVPTHAGDTVETIQSLEKWPSKCTDDTLANVDLVIYKAEAYDSRIENEARTEYDAVLRGFDSPTCGIEGRVVHDNQCMYKSASRHVG